MSAQIFIANLRDESVDESDVYQLVNEVAAVRWAKLVTKGNRTNYAFVELLDPTDVQLVIDTLDQTDYRGRTLHVARTRDQQENNP